jgi:hypothetical protein
MRTIEFRKQDTMSRAGLQPNVGFAELRRENNKYIQLSGFLSCKSYLNDYLVGDYIKTDLKRAKTVSALLLHVGQASERRNFEKNISILNKLEEECGYSPTTYTIVEVEKKKTRKGFEAYLIRGDKKWTTSLLMQALWQLLHRALCNTTGATDYKEFIKRTKTEAYSYDGRTIYSLGYGNVDWLKLMMLNHKIFSSRKGGVLHGYIDENRYGPSYHAIGPVGLQSALQEEYKMKPPCMYARGGAYAYWTKKLLKKYPKVEDLPKFEESTEL